VIILDKPEAEYHADPTTLSQSGAKELLKSPKRFRYQLDHPTPPTESMKTGTATHELVFFGEVRSVVEKTWNASTTAGKKARDEAAAQGLETISSADWKLAHDMAEAILNDAEARELFSDGKPEVSVYGEDPLTGVAMRGRFDWWRDDNTIVDLKTGRDSSISGFRRAVAEHRYFLQDAWYRQLADVNGFPAKDFVFVVVDKEPPFLPAVHRLDERAVQAGNFLIDTACQMYRDCKEAEEMFGLDAWPKFGRPTQPGERLSLPVWALSEAEDQAWL
jgi:hypothetical protein